MFQEIIPHLIPLLGAGLLAGFLAGLLGIGGGVVTIPVLFVVFEPLGVPIEWRMHVAIATSLAVIMATNLSSALAHHRKAAVDVAILKQWWLFIALGAFAGSIFAKQLKTSELVYVFAAFATLLAIKMLLPMDRMRFGSTIPKGMWQYLHSGIIGFVSAIMGIGGGNLSVPYLTLYGMHIHRAVGTASVIGLIIALVGSVGYMMSGQNIAALPNGTLGLVNLPSAFVIASASVIMAPIGAKVAHQIPKTILSAIFGVFLVLAVVRMITSV